MSLPILSSTVALVGDVTCCNASRAECNSIITSLHRLSSPKLRNNNSIPCTGPSESNITLSVPFLLNSLASSYSSNFWNVSSRNSCGVKDNSKLRSKVCCISTAINESMPISESVVPKERDLRSRAPKMFIMVSIIFSLPEVPNCFSATTMLATMASGALSNLILGAIFPVSKAKQTLTSEHIPEAGSAWPAFDLTEPTNNGVER
ncbi:hypothetical protein GQX74_000781 [Glossina fuscipes]|nr:hypothetical protein GQX74_000781 [Glossina fuscipes]